MDEAKEKTAAEIEAARREEIVAGLRVTNRGLQPFEYSSASAGIWIVYRRTEKGEREVYRKLTRDDRRSDAQDSLMSCVLYPPKAEFAALLDDNPFLVEMLETAILNASGLHLDAVQKKL